MVSKATGGVLELELAPPSHQVLIRTVMAQGSVIFTMLVSI